MYAFFLVCQYALNIALRKAPFLRQVREVSVVQHFWILLGFSKGMGEMNQTNKPNAVWPMKLQFSHNATIKNESQVTPATIFQLFC